MASNIDLYPRLSRSTSGVSNLSLYPSGRGREVDLRDELANTLYGGQGEVAKGQTGLLRRMRTDSDGNLIDCDCKDEVTHEPDMDYPCENCRSAGWLWDEEWLTYYKVLASGRYFLSLAERHVEAGVLHAPPVLFYVEYDVEPTRYDQVIELQRDTDGVLTRPYTRTKIYNIETAEPLRSDNGRTEYWRLGCSEWMVTSKSYKESL